MEIGISFPNKKQGNMMECSTEGIKNIPLLLFVSYDQRQSSLLDIISVCSGERVVEVDAGG
ncbi:hypothetical protein C5167_020875, partial [Papaver somniferum]